MIKNIARGYKNFCICITAAVLLFEPSYFSYGGYEAYYKVYLLGAYPSFFLPQEIYFFFQMKKCLLFLRFLLFQLTLLFRTYPFGDHKNFLILYI